MRYLWDTEPCFMKDLRDALPEPKPAKTTIATLLKRMIDKDLVGFKTFGNSREYFTKVSKRDYFGRHLRGMIGDFFRGYPKDLASLFVEDTELTDTQLEELRRIIDRKLEDNDR